MNCNRAKYDVHAVYAECPERTKAKEDMQDRVFEVLQFHFARTIIWSTMESQTQFHCITGSNQTVIIFISKFNHCSVTHYEEEFRRKFLTCRFAIGYFVHE